MKRKLAIWIIVAILAGILPPWNVPAGSSAAEADEAVSAETDETGQEGHGLHNPVTDENGVRTWDCVYFGRYWMYDTNGDYMVDRNDERQPIKWRVLSVDGDDAFLLADQVLDCQRYNNTCTDVTWETCTLRSWLNGYGPEANKEGADYSSDNFLANAFSEEERSDILITNVINSDNSYSNISDVNDTLDKVYILSLKEATNPAYGFSSDKNKIDAGRAVTTTLYGEKYGVWSVVVAGALGNALYWLRSRGDFDDFATEVGYNGTLNQGALARVDCSGRGIRPVLHLNLKGSSEALGANWSYAGTVTAEGGDVRTEPPAESKNPWDDPSGGIGQEKRELHDPVTDENGIRTWDCVYFGSYWQEDTNGDGKVDKSDEKKPIRWRVLSVDGDDAFLMSDKILGSRAYNDNKIDNTWGEMDITWENCTLRSWLNGYGEEINADEKDYTSDNFLINAFSEEERSSIKTTHVVDNEGYNEKHAGNDTLDQIYLLSYNEVRNLGYGFSADEKKLDKGRKAKTTKYAREEGVYTCKGPGENTDNGWWWLRSRSDREEFYAGCVDVCGCAYESGDEATYKYNGVRPVLHMNLKGSSEVIGSGWSYAGTVTAEEGDIGTVTPVESKKPDAGPTSKPTPEVTKTETPTERPLPQESKEPGEGPIEDYGLHNPATNEKGITTWDCVYFGNYWQDDTNEDGVTDQNDEKQPIKWRVLSVDGDDAFLLSDKNIDSRQYNLTHTDVTWETCSVRSWLNGYGAEANIEGADYSSNNFLVDAFSVDERSAIKITNVVTNNKGYGIGGEIEAEGGNDTSDQVYFLSLDEVKNPVYGFLTDGSTGNSWNKYRKSETTRFAKKRAGLDEIEPEGVQQYMFWLLRSPGMAKCVTCVESRGYLSAGTVQNLDSVIRPALHLNLKATQDSGSTPVWSYAGTVSAGGEDIRTESPAPSGTEAPPQIPSGTEAPSQIPSGTEAPPQFPSGTEAPSQFPLGTEAPLETVSPQPTPVLQPTASPIPDSAGKGSSIEKGSSIGKVTSVKLKQKKQSVMASWKKVSGADGYQVCYSMSKKWKKKTQKLTADTKMEIKKMKKKKTYYFCIRAYRKDGAKKVYGAWSNTKKVKIKK